MAIGALVETMKPSLSYYIGYAQKRYFNIKFSSFDILYADSDSFPEPMRVYSLPTKEMRSFDFHVDYFGKCTATSEISISNFSPHLTYSLVYRTPVGNIISMRLATTSE